MVIKMKNKVSIVVPCYNSSKTIIRCLDSILNQTYENIEILLIDEILAVGDQHFQDKCFAKLEELAQSNMTIVIVSHSLDYVKKLCNRAIWINEGVVARDGKCSDVIDEYLKVCG